MTLRSAAAHRNLLYLLSLKELRTRYKKSILGWAWSLLNPLTQMGIFTVIFLVIFKAVPQIGDPSGLKNFPLYFLAGMLPFNFFSISVGVVDGSRAGWRRPDQEGAVPARAPRLLGGRCPVRHLADRARRADGGDVVSRATTCCRGYPCCCCCWFCLAVFTTGVSLGSGRSERLLPRRQLPVGHPLADPVLRHAGDLEPGDGRARRGSRRSPTTTPPAASSSPPTT